MPTTLNSGLQLPDKGSVDWYSSMQNNYNLLDNHLENTDIHVTAEDKANWNSKQGSLSQAQLDAIAQVSTNTDDIATLQSGKANASHTHSSSDITDIGDYATKQYVDNSISGLVDSAPNALDTLNELAAALNDDANFASTVTTALSAKVNSSDLATVATSGSYNDLSNKPTINDSTITIQKNGSTIDTFTTNGSNKTINISVPTKTSDLTNDSDFAVSSNLATVATSGDYDDLSNKPSIPTNTSDLINDSNFVDTSNSAVASGITSAKVTSYDSHIADTDIHVTTADKTKWNNGVSQSYVFRYSSTALVASSTNSNTLLDNTDNLKVGDKVIDSDGVLFSITAIDTVNSTFTIGSALVDLALDANVVHTSGDETVNGKKTFNDLQIIGYGTQYKGARNAYILPEFSAGYSGLSITTLGFSQAVKIGSFVLDANNKPSLDASKGYIQFATGENNGVNVCILEPRNSTSSSLGTSANRWSKIYGTEYYYGSNNIEFSTKFVTTDTNQTISGAKTFSDNLTIYNSDNTQTPKGLTIRNAQWGMGESGGTTGSNINFLDKNSSIPASIIASKGLYGQSFLRFSVRTKDSQNTTYLEEIYYVVDTSGNVDFRPWHDNSISLGTSAYKWKDVQTKLINGLTPSSLGMPDIANKIDISGYITDLTGNLNTYTPPANGWISIQTDNSSVSNYIRCDYDVIMVKSSGNAQGSALSCLVPVLANKQVNIRAKCTTLTSAYFVPCQGNI